jgi:hypothetical protein
MESDMSKTLSRIPGTGEIIDPKRLTRNERLERWALALERRKDARLRTLRETEYKPYYERLAMREDNSPLTVAFEEPVLRSAGLRDDTFGEAARFFELSEWELHTALCYCHFGPTVRASEVAARVRSLQATSSTGVGSSVRTYALGAGALAGLTWLLLAL